MFQKYYSERDRYKYMNVWIHLVFVKHNSRFALLNFCWLHRHCFIFYYKMKIIWQSETGKYSQKQHTIKKTKTISNLLIFFSTLLGIFFQNSSLYYSTIYIWGNKINRQKHRQQNYEFLMNWSSVVNTHNLLTA